MPSPRELLQERYKSVISETIMSAGMASLKQKILGLFKRQAEPMEDTEGESAVVDISGEPYTSKMLDAQLDCCLDTNSLISLGNYLGFWPDEAESLNESAGALYGKDIELEDPSAKSTPILGSSYTPITGVPPIGRSIVLVYNNKGQYMGWWEQSTAKKFRNSGGLHNVNRLSAQRIYGVNSNDSNNVKIVEVATGNIALVLQYKTLTPAALVDQSDAIAKIEATLNALKKTIKEEPLYKWEYIRADEKKSIISDPFDILKLAIVQGIKNRDAEYARLDQLKKIGTDKFRKDLVAYLEDQLAAKHLLKTASDELGIEMDI